MSRFRRGGRRGGGAGSGHRPGPPSAEQLRAWGLDPAWSRTIEVPSHDGGSHEWHVLDRSPGDGVAAVATIVCVHGNPTWSVYWRSLIERLGDRYRVIAVDQLGMGWSERPGHRRFAERVADLGDVIDALDLDGPVVVAAHDWGGPIALGWVLEHRKRVAGVVLCNTGVAVPAGRRAPWVIRLAGSGPITWLVGHRTRTFVDGTIVLSWRRLEPSMRAALRAPYRRARNRVAIADFVNDIPLRDGHPSADAIASVAEGVRTLEIPVLLAWGGRDPVFDDDFLTDLGERMPHADRHRVGAAGHLVVAETSVADVAGVVDAWLTERAMDRTPAPVTAPGVTATVHTAPVDSAFRPVWAALTERAGDDAVAVVDGATGVRTSFAELNTTVERVAAGLVEQGLRPGDRVAVLVPPGVDLVITVYAVWRAGGVTVIADRGLGLRGLRNAVRAAHVHWVVGPPKSLAASRLLRWAPRARSIAVHYRRILGAEATLHELSLSTAPSAPGPSASDPAAVVYTSGATGPAKGVRYRHVQLAAQRDALAALYEIGPDDRLIAAFAPFALFGPALGIASTIPDVDVTAPGTLTAEALGAACAGVDGTIVFASPAALANVLRSAHGPDPRLARVRLVLSAGAPVPIATLRATAALLPAAVLRTPYGMTECLPVSDVSLDVLDAAAGGRGVCVGRPVDGVDVLIAPLGFDATTPVAALSDSSVMGEVLVRAPWCSDGYDQLWRTEREARPVDAEGRTWHRTGDVGHVDHDGRLWIEGRSVHVIATVEGPVTPVPVEVAVETLDGVTTAAAVGVGPRGCQQVVVVLQDSAAERRLAGDAIAAKVRAVVEARVGCPVAAVLTTKVLPVDIRHNTKIDRAAVATWASAVLAGDRARARPMSRR